MRKNNLTKKEKAREYRRKKYQDYKVNKKWYLHWRWAKDRCERLTAQNYRFYGAIGIRFLLTLRQIHLIWLRDKAYSLKQSSLDRIDSKGDYEFFNCRFIERNENTRTK
jgi:hypothetical protein